MADRPPGHPQTVTWSGELLWPRELADGDIIDLAAVQALGSWVLSWFREHPGRAVTRASPAVRRQLVRAGVTVVWVDPAPPPGPGITASERAMLLEGDA